MELDSQTKRVRPSSAKAARPTPTPDDPSTSHVKLAILQHILQREECISELLETVQHHAVDAALLLSFLPLLRLCTLAVRSDTDFLDGALAESILGLSSLCSNPFFTSLNLTAPQLRRLASSEELSDDMVSCIVRRVRFGEDASVVDPALATRVVRAMVHIVREEILVDAAMPMRTLAPLQWDVRESAGEEAPKKRRFKLPPPPSTDATKVEAKPTKASPPSAARRRRRVDTSSSMSELQRIFELCNDVTTAAGQLQAQLRVLDEATGDERPYVARVGHARDVATCVESVATPVIAKPEAALTTEPLVSAADLVEIIPTEDDDDVLRSITGRLQTLRALVALDDDIAPSVDKPTTEVHRIEPSPEPIVSVSPTTKRKKKKRLEAPKSPKARATTSPVKKPVIKQQPLASTMRTKYSRIKPTTPIVSTTTTIAPATTTTAPATTIMAPATTIMAPATATTVAILEPATSPPASPPATGQSNTPLDHLRPSAKARPVTKPSKRLASMTDVRAEPHFPSTRAARSQSQSLLAPEPLASCPLPLECADASATPGDLDVVPRLDMLSVEAAPSTLSARHRRRSLDHRRRCLLQHRQSAATTLQHAWRCYLRRQRQRRRNTAASILAAFWCQCKRRWRRHHAAAIVIQSKWLEHREKRRQTRLLHERTAQLMGGVVVQCIHRAIDQHLRARAAGRFIAKWILRVYRTTSAVPINSAAEADVTPSLNPLDIATAANEVVPVAFDIELPTGLAVPAPSLASEEATAYYMSDEFDDVAPPAVSLTPSLPSLLSPRALQLTYFVEWMTNSLRCVQFRSIQTRALRHRRLDAFRAWEATTDGWRRRRDAFHAWADVASAEATKRAQLRIEFAQDAKAWKKLRSGVRHQRWTKAIEGGRQHGES
ncbi:hypothetical protein SPRG_01232 [Saprolegnia parasitica CBS 223.65]|uniref:Uncharacterized protein n=1 Tax=Saprolegnia parasitica (strain CBS 223.65) TaxID=695850 RepID=A0A067CTB8_SAPPC|nr:hypothetical protein SPRG_01232 [Saprolegnia parasitica CBS 223.65]KDO33954.1 hypothetical protein SPRG_01232 [Saprolegnia parasitica CBS 223.65]|eukprot:XP_012194847.1 hypothetical protein SPRG_01232 [Saprolegnia parasitica CBS 223.65]